MKKTCIAAICLMIVTCAGLTGCGEDEPRFASDQISIKIGVKEGDVVGTQVEGRKNVSTEVSNPYAHFLQIIQEEFGDDKVEIKVEGVTLQLIETKDDVAVFEDLFSGTVEVFLSPDDTAAGYVVGTTDSLTGSGPTPMEEGPAARDLRSFIDTLMSGTFRVGIRGETALTPASKFDCKIAITLSFGAYDW